MGAEGVAEKIYHNQKSSTYSAACNNNVTSMYKQWCSIGYHHPSIQSQQLQTTSMH